MADSQSMVEASSPSVEVIAPRRYRLMAVVMVLTAVFTIAYWGIWFGGGRALLASSQAASYFVFENAFPAADTWFAVLLLFGAVGLLQRRSWGLLFSLLAGGAGIYLGCMDVLYDLENRIYSIPAGADPSAVIIEIVINILTFAISITIISYVWRHRGWLLSTASSR